ncbi:MAG: hypothetical protein LBM07_05315 [Culturomica sp.]|jgi:hypothetical protein|nr:hypothetical protein [Culturomica sp.]
MNIIQQSFDFLSINNYQPINIGNSIIKFTASGINCLLFWDIKDVSYLKIDARFELSQFDATTETMLKKCNRINKERKVIKAHINYDDDVLILSTEVLLDDSPEVDSLLGRLISMITTSILMLA